MKNHERPVSLDCYTICGSKAEYKQTLFVPFKGWEKRRCQTVVEEKTPFDSDDELEIDNEIICILNHTPCSHLVQIVDGDILDINRDTSKFIFSQSPQVEESRNPPLF